jgi:hypothetical protein
MKKILLKLMIGLVIILVFLSFYAGKKAKKITYGITFSPYQALDLGLDWKKTYLALLDDVGVKNLRLSAYWNRIEPKRGEYDWTDLDFQIKEAEKRQAKIVLSVGRRLPRWPECHDPQWLKEENLAESLKIYVEAVVNRYKNNPAVVMWQVENEAFHSVFGICPKLDTTLFDQEIALVKKLDPNRPVVITDSGELSLWLKAGKRGDAFGSTLYRHVFSDVFNRYWINYNPYWLYRAKGGLMKLLNGKKELMIIELQAEPWTTKGILGTSIEEQFKTMSMEKFKTILSVGKATGFEKQYLWGGEWWYWMKQNGHPEFWETARILMNKN